ncbi:hypothetical protein EV424DRAFT_1327116 [Suillus variegatus]|nr:hypothetical protein EV424DRAFT_1327116 [Suillus variegatus]
MSCFCTNCCRKEHVRLPFHQISQWTGGFFEESWDADDIPGLTAYATEQNEQPTGEQTWIPNDLPTGVLFIKHSKQITTIVDKSRVHTHKIKYCRCADALTTDIQLCQMGLFLASFAQTKTAFTFQVVDDFWLDNLECGTSAMNYYNKLRRMTTSVFPHLVPDRYHELMRVARQWRQLQLLKWNGFGHESKDRKPGDLALSCPACLQTGINVTLPPEDKQEETNSKSELPKFSRLYSRSLVMDGNFKNSPQGYGDGTYKAHLAQANDAVQWSECNNHHAVNQANATRHRLEATGISGCACARHGCFITYAMVNFQKGERQMNMDYAVCEVLKHNASGIQRALTFYDINCQYHKYLRDWVSGMCMATKIAAMYNMPAISSPVPHELMARSWRHCGCRKALCQIFRQAVKGVTESTTAFQKLNESANAAKVIE